MLSQNQLNINVCEKLADLAAVTAITIKMIKIGTRNFASLKSQISMMLGVTMLVCSVFNLALINGILNLFYNRSKKERSFLSDVLTTKMISWFVFVLG
jgi:hypothetical protein